MLKLCDHDILFNPCSNIVFLFVWFLFVVVVVVFLCFGWLGWLPMVSIWSINASQNGSEFCYTHFNIFTLSLFRVEQIGCYMGFSINASVIAFAMFICYCIAVDEFSTIIRCYNLNYPSQYYGSYNYRYSSCYHYRYSYYKLNRHTASIGAGLGGCLLVCAVVETVIALTASIYCCNAVCCGATTSPTVSSKVMQWSIYNQQFL